MKRKIYLNGRFLTQSVTGVQRTAIELVKALDRLIDQRIIDKEIYDFYLIYSGHPVISIELIHIKPLKKGWMTGNLWEQFELPLYTVGSLLVSMCTVSTLFKTNQIVIIHDASTLVNPSFFPLALRLWYKIAIPTLGKIVKHVVTVSNFSKGELIKHAGIRDEKISVIYNSAEHILRYRDPDNRFKDKILAAQPYFLAVSSLGANKNFKGLIEAVEKADLQGYRMLIAGGRVATLKHAAPATLQVTYLGYVADDQLRFLYANASLFIFPSFYEGFGIPPLEAMISGCAVLASDTSSLPEVLGDACVYCDPANPDVIAGRINSVINDKNILDDLIQKGYRQAGKYSWHTSALELFALIQVK